MLLVILISYYSIYSKIILLLLKGDDTVIRHKAFCNSLNWQLPQSCTPLVMIHSDKKKLHVDLYTISPGGIVHMQGAFLMLTFKGN